MKLNRVKSDHYPVVLADPPWGYSVFTKKGTGQTSERHYPSMTDLELCLMEPEIKRVSKKNSILFMWSTSPLLATSIYIMGVWGFSYKTVAFTWIKMTKGGTPCFGLGHYTRPATELCLMGVRGKIAGAVKSHSVRQVVLAERGKHSQKPEEVQDRIEDLFDGPYLELFARRKRKGWRTWGNQEA